MAIFDNLAKEYDTWFYENENLFNSELDAIKALMPNFTNALDIGCGTGIFTKALGINDGIDPSDMMLNIAKMRNLNVKSGSTTSLEIKKGEYDLFTMITVDCFIEDLNPTFKSLASKLNKGGYLLIAFLNKDTELGAMYEATKNDSEYYKHSYFHSDKEIVECAKSHGFSLVRGINTIYTLDNVYQHYYEGFNKGVFSIALLRKEEE